MGDGNRGFPDRAERGTGVSMADVFQLAQPPLPERLTPQVLREAIARTLRSRVKAYDIAGECVRLGLPPERQGENPWNSKWNYVEPRLRHRKLAELLAIAEKVTDVYDDQLLERLLALAGASGVSGEMKNLIFASTGPKPSTTPTAAGAPTRRATQSWPRPTASHGSADMRSTVSAGTRSPTASAPQRSWTTSSAACSPTHADGQRGGPPVGNPGQGLATGGGLPGYRPPARRGASRQPCPLGSLSVSTQHVALPVIRRWG